MATLVVLLALGAALLLLETILPGFVAGALGILCLIGGVIVSYFEFGIRFGNFILALTGFGLVFGTALWLKFFPDTPLAKRFISTRQIGTLGAEPKELIGQTGVAYTTLRPSGAAMIQGRRVDVIAEGELIERGAPIKVVAVEGLRVIVRRAS